MTAFRKLDFRWRYIIGRARWDSGITPPEVVAAFEAGNIPADPALDLGCGTGTNVIYMAQQGRQVIGIDFAPEAIRKAKRKAKSAGVSASTRLLVGDVTQLAKYDLPSCAYALDLGCLHGLSVDMCQKYAAALKDIMMPGGWYMLYFMHPSADRPIPIGMLPSEAEALFAPHFTVTRHEQGEFRGRASSWMWFRRSG